MRTLIGLLFTIALVPKCYCAEDSSAANRFDFSFSGGTATQLVEALKVASGTNISSLIPKRMAANKVIPSVSLKDTNVKAVLLSLSKLKAETVGVWVNVEKVWVLVEPEQEEKTIYIGHLLHAFDQETIAETIQKSWRCEREVYKESGGGGTTIADYYWYFGVQGAPFTELTYEPKTKILIAKAAPAQIRVVIDLVKQLEIAAKALPDEKPGSNPRSEQGGACQPATAADSKSEDDRMPKPESEGCSH